LFDDLPVDEAQNDDFLETHRLSPAFITVMN